MSLGYADSGYGRRESSRPFPTQGALQINARCSDEIFTRRIARNNAGLPVRAKCNNSGVVRNVVEMQVPVFSLAPTHGDTGSPPDVWTDWSMMPEADSPVFEGFAATMSSPDERHPDSIAVTVNGILQVRNTGDRSINDGDVVIWTYPYTAQTQGRWRAVNAPASVIGIPAGIRGLRPADFTIEGMTQLAAYDPEFSTALDGMAGNGDFNDGWIACQKLYNLFHSRTIGVARVGAEPGGEVYLELRSLGFLSAEDIFPFRP